MDNACSPTLSYGMFEPELRQAQTLLGDNHLENDYPRPMLKICLNLPAPAILAKWLEDLEKTVYRDMNRGSMMGSEHGLEIITAHRAYPNRDDVILTLTLPAPVWEVLQHSQLLDHITLLGRVAEPNVIGDTQMTHLLVRAAKRVNEGPLFAEEFANDLERMKRALSDGLTRPARKSAFTFPRVMFTTNLRTDLHQRLDRGESADEDTTMQWSEIDPSCLSSNVHLDFVSEVVSEDSSEVTFVIAKQFWPYLEATSEIYRFVRYLDEQQYNELLANNERLQMLKETAEAAEK